MTEETEKKEAQVDAKNDIEQQNMETIKKMQDKMDKMVPKEEYEKVKNELKDIHNKILEGDAIIKDDKEDSSETIEQLRKELYSEDGKDLTDLEYVSKSLKLRKLIIESGGEDPFLPKNASASDIASAEQVAQFYEDCVEQANGSNSVFLANFQNGVRDAVPLRKR